jgi:putative sterol carrier protein
MESNPHTGVTGTRGGRAARFFFMYLGTPAVIILYFIVCGAAPFSAVNVRNALVVALVVQTGYNLLAYYCGELKQFDIGLWVLFALGAAAGWTGADGSLFLFQQYSPALVPGVLGLTALLPLLLGWEPFTMYFARRQVPRWQQQTPQFPAVNRVMTGYWALVFSVAAILAAWVPTDLRFTALYPNLVIFGLGMTAGLWLPNVYLRFFPGDLPQTVEPLIMGMPFAFARRAARDARATIQFQITGAQPGDYYLHVDGGRCQSFEGLAAAPDLTIRTPDSVWLRIARGELDGQEALLQGLYSVEGDLAMLVNMREWFPARR